MLNWRHRLREAGRRAGVDVSRYRPLARRRAALLETLGIAVALDVGANVGQYGRELREHGFRGRIVSFEPLSSARARLEAAAADDPRWEVQPLALGDERGITAINIASNLASSSLLPLLDAHLAMAPDVAIVAHEEVEVATLDELGLELEGPALLKLDVQGYEDRVLRGAASTLAGVELVECELSIVELYGRQLRLDAMLRVLGE